MSYGGDPRVEVFVFIILCTEILLVPLTLLQTHDGAVCATRRNTDKHLLYRANDDGLVRLYWLMDEYHAMFCFAFFLLAVPEL